MKTRITALTLILSLTLSSFSYASQSSNRSFLNDIEDEANGSDKKASIVFLTEFSVLTASVITSVVMARRKSTLLYNDLMAKSQLESATTKHKQVSDLLDEVQKINPKLIHERPDLVAKLILQAEKANVLALKDLIDQDGGTLMATQRRSGTLWDIEKFGKHIKNNEIRIQNAENLAAENRARSISMGYYEHRENLKATYWQYVKEDAIAVVKEYQYETQKNLEIARAAIKEENAVALAKAQHWNKVAFIGMMITMTEFFGVYMQMVLNPKEIDVLPGTGMYEMAESLIQLSLEAINIEN